MSWGDYITAGGDRLPSDIVQLLEGVEGRLTLAHELNTGRDGAR